MSNVITVKPRSQEQFDYTLEDLYHSSYFDIVMNCKTKFNEKKYEIILNFISPSISWQFYKSDPKKAVSLLENYKNINKKEKTYLDKMPDTAGAMDHMFKSYLKTFQSDLKTLGFDEALDKNQDFYFLCEEIYRTLPSSFVFSLINIMENLQRD